MRVRAWVGVLAMVVGSAGAYAQKGLLLVAQKGDKSLAIVDPWRAKCWPTWRRAASRGTK